MTGCGCGPASCLRSLWAGLGASARQGLASPQPTMAPSSDLMGAAEDLADQVSLPFSRAPGGRVRPAWARAAACWDVPFHLRGEDGEGWREIPLLCSPFSSVFPPCVE